MKTGTTFTELFGLDLRSLAALRIGLALIILVDLANRARYLVAHYTDAGVFPREALHDYSQLYINPSFLSFHSLSGSWEFQAFLFILAGLAACMLLVGYHTRFATIISWVLLVSLHSRNPLILQGGDLLLRLILFWAMFLPLGARYALDSVKKISFPSTNIYSTMASAAFMLQIAFLYFFTGLLKTGAEWVSDGTAVYYALSIDQLVTPIGSLFVSFHPLLVYLTFATLGLELLGPFLLFFPFKTYTFRLFSVLGFIGLHIGLMTTLHLGPFPWIGIVSMIALLPPPFWKFLSRIFQRKEYLGLVMYYDGDCGFCQKTTQYIKTFMLIPKLSIFPAAHDKSILQDMITFNSWVILDPDKQRHYKFDGVITVLQASPLFWFLTPVLKIPFIFRIGNTLYEYIASHRKTQCYPFEHQPSTKKSFVPSTLLKMSPAALLTLILISFFWNLQTTQIWKYSIPLQLQQLAYALRLDQNWNMFAPSPFSNDGWYVAKGTLQNGKVIDISKKGAPISLEKPKRLQQNSGRWRYYILNLSFPEYKPFLPYYAQFLCNSWNTNRSSTQQILQLDLIFVLERTLPNYELPLAEPRSVVNYTCGERISLQ